MVKLTKRKGFNFYRSYYDVFNELEKDKDKLAFISALLDKQFLGVEPELKGIVRFAYISQMNNINDQVKGWESKTKQTLSPPCQGGSVGGRQAPSVQEKEKEKEKEETCFSFDDFMKVYPNRTKLKDARIKYDKLSEDKRMLIKNTVKDFVNNIPFPTYNHPSPTVYINQERWDDELKPTKQQKKLVGVRFDIDSGGNL